MVPLFTAVWVLATAVLAQVLIDRWARGPGSKPSWYRLWAQVGLSAAIGAALYGARFILPDAWVFGVAFAAMLVQTIKATRAVSFWRRFFRALDAARAAEDTPRIEALLDLRRPPAERRAYHEWAARILIAGLRVHEAGGTERAYGWLGTLDPARVLAPHRLRLSQSRATLAIVLGDRAAARAALALVPPEEIPPGPTADAFALLVAILDVLDGDASDERLASVRAGRAGAPSPASEKGWATIEAHVLAARDDISGATKLLERFVADPKALARIARHGGAASPIAASLLGGQPYR